jgi:hypothetical protein
MDGSNFEVADEKENVAAFGYPGSRTGEAGYPQAQCAPCREFLDLSGSVAHELSAFLLRAGSGGGRSPEPLPALGGAPGERSGGLFCDLGNGCPVVVIVRQFARSMKHG